MSKSPSNMTIKICINRLPKLLNILKHSEAQLLKTTVTSRNQSQRFYSNDTKLEARQIYYGVLTPQIKAVKLFSFSSSIVGVICQPFLYKAIVSTGNVPIIIAAYTSIGFFTFITPFLLHFITKKYVTHLNYKEDTDSYTAKTINFFCITKETEFKTNDVIVPDVPGMFTTLIAKGKPLFFDPSLQQSRHHYMKIMGFDKPIDYRIKLPPIEKKN